ncbi:MAG: hypothetical protein MJZ16_04810 [Bacteroidales bacterium]|nr:hypothetical protein [Bacteroidales bacterium]
MKYILSILLLVCALSVSAQQQKTAAEQTDVKQLQEQIEDVVKQNEDLRAELDSGKAANRSIVLANDTLYKVFKSDIQKAEEYKESNEVNWSRHLTAIDVIAGLIAVIVTLFAGYQIYNVVDVKNLLSRIKSEFDDAQKKQEEQNGQFKEQNQELQKQKRELEQKLEEQKEEIKALHSLSEHFKQNQEAAMKNLEKVNDSIYDYEMFVFGHYMNMGKEIKLTTEKNYFRALGCYLYALKTAIKTDSYLVDNSYFAIEELLRDEKWKSFKYDEITNNTARARMIMVDSEIKKLEDCESKLAKKLRFDNLKEHIKSVLPQK